MPFDVSYSVVLNVHIAAFFFSIACVIIADLSGLLWMLRKWSVLPATFIYTLHYLISIGIISALVTGALLSWSTIQFLLTQTSFWIKLSFILALCINAFVIHKHMKLATTRTYPDVTKSERKILFISGAISTISWIGVFVSAQFLGL